VVAVMGDVFILVCNFHVPLGFRVACPSSDVGCDVEHIFLCVGLLAIFCGVAFFYDFFLLVCILLFLGRGVVCLGCRWSFYVFALFIRITRQKLN
jgi:hypothetical protein